MALIHCPECEEKISDKAAACPKCGYPMRDDENIPFLAPLAELAEIFSRNVREIFGPEYYSQRRKKESPRRRPEKTEDPED